MIKQVKTKDMDLEDLSKQGEYSAIENLKRVVKDLDELYGRGFSEKHTELVGKLVLAAAVDYSGTLLHQDIEKLNERLSDLISDNE